ncbi:hypothetical protein SYNPS1DRAFT_16968 [Syncephalis pseudoplumigaleata]|uniref:Peptide hydrolase n=1 Tax=Syncephalis pseudoplumigaleata TaxID=1712513 RepID=A0A4V1J1C6_9FUNG|nr:hypothetical protein SYNPS1DRAFT_16968 [Syncephalis pseudoplumigaleata]|eukprot:RKP24589.1 hypothetical protein SYNPS1DRAFT_16968 [Syncephalis pseudoplumigaleata]
MLQSFVRLILFFAVLQQAWSVDYLQQQQQQQQSASTSLQATEPGVEHTPAANATPATATATATEAEREENLRTIAQLPGLEKLAVPNGAYLKPFLVPRPVGSEEHRQVQDYIRRTFTALGWHVEEDRFDDRTPLGVKTFNNIIVTKFPEATRQLVLSAHYDSLYFPPPNEKRFIGATDSSVPCAMLVDIATSLNSRLDRLRGTGRGLQIIFFDGEEAFVKWGPTDSTYGSRHLAKVWSAGSSRAASSANGAAPPRSRIESIEMLVLLDLLGVKDTILRDLQTTTTAQFKRISQLERRAAADAASDDDYYFRPYGEFGFRSGIQDDHVPFVQRGVPVLHLIPPVFPEVWHQFTDNASALDEATIRHLTIVMRVFVADYLGLAQF